MENATVSSTGNSPIVLFTGGIDSTVALTVALRNGITPIPFEVDYDGRPEGERQAAIRVLQHFGLLKEVNTMRLASTRANHGSISLSYVTLLSLAQDAVTSSHTAIVSVIKDDVSGAGLMLSPYYFGMIERGLRLNNSRGFQILTPFIMLSKFEVFQLGQSLDAPLDLTWSCFAKSLSQCGECYGCVDALAASGHKL